MQRVDVAVLGGGLAGLATAWNLADHLRVQVFEQGRQPGEEASAQNAGMLRRLAHDPVERQLAVRSAARLITPGEDWADAPPYRRTGAVLALAEPDPTYESAVADLRAQGVDVQSAPPVPALEGAEVARSWYLPEEGLIDAHALVWGFVRGIRRMGGELVPRREVAVLVEAGRVVGLQTESGPVAADAVVVAGGAWSGRVARQLGLVRPLVPLQRHLLVTAPHAVSRPDHPWTWIDDLGVYVRPEAGGWLCSPCDETPVEPNPGPGSRGPVDPFYRALAVHKLEQHLPAVADARFVGGWTGLRTFTPDRRPMLGADPDVSGLFWATGLGGFGVTCCHASGEFVADQVLGRPTDWLRSDSVAPGRTFEPAILPVRGMAENATT